MKMFIHCGACVGTSGTSPAVLYLREWHEAQQLCVSRDNTLIVLEMRNWTLGYAKKAFLRHCRIMTSRSFTITPANCSMPNLSMKAVHLHRNR